MGTPSEGVYSARPNIAIFKCWNQILYWLTEYPVKMPKACYSGPAKLDTTITFSTPPPPPETKKNQDYLKISSSAWEILRELGKSALQPSAPPQQAKLLYFAVVLFCIWARRSHALFIHDLCLPSEISHHRWNKLYLAPAKWSAQSILIGKLIIQCWKCTESLICAVEDKERHSPCL